jgi:signal transduction histidine kinase
VVTDAPGRAFSQDELALAETVAADVAAAIGNAMLYEQAQELAATQERERLARDLHDSVTQTLYSISVIAEALPRVWERYPDEARVAVTELHRLSRGALAEMRTLLLELRPAMLLEKELGELIPQLARAAMNRMPIEITSSVAGTHDLPDEVQIALYRIAQEALNNVIRHADANHASLELQLEPEQVVLCIRDNGRGFDTDSTRTDGFGLHNMAERARAIGARYHLESQPGQGTWVEVIWRNSAGDHSAESKSKES